MDSYAIFIDGDNISPKHFPLINDLIRKRGKIVLKKVYADFSEENTKGWKKACLDFGIEAIIAWRDKGKNSTDIKMTIDLMDILNNYKHIHNFVIATGDVDFKELCSKISSYGKHVIGISCYEQSTSKTLKNYCNEFIILDNLDSCTDNIDDSVKNKLLPAIKDVLEDEPHINLGLLKQRLLNIDPLFSELNFGFRNFTELIKSFSDVKLTKDKYGNYLAHI